MAATTKTNEHLQRTVTYKAHVIMTYSRPKWVKYFQRPSCCLSRSFQGSKKWNSVFSPGNVGTLFQRQLSKHQWLSYTQQVYTAPPQKDHPTHSSKFVKSEPIFIYVWEILHQFYWKCNSVSSDESIFDKQLSFDKVNATTRWSEFWETVHLSTFLWSGWRQWKTWKAAATITTSQPWFLRNLLVDRGKNDWTVRQLLRLRRLNIHTKDTKITQYRITCASTTGTALAFDNAASEQFTTKDGLH